jgi:hypothetical protein
MISESTYQSGSVKLKRDVIAKVSTTNEYLLSAHLPQTGSALALR